MSALLPVEGLAVDVDEHSLAFVLGLVDGRADIAGLDEDRMAALLADGDALAIGRERLTAQGLAVDDDGIDVDPRLLYLCAVIAAPTLTVDAQVGDRSVTFHVASDQIVEVTRVGPDRYQLVGLTDPAEIGQRTTELAASVLRPR